MCFIEPLSTWTRMMRYWPKRKTPRRGKCKKMHGKTWDGRQLEPETDRKIGAPNPQLKGSQVSPCWPPQLIKSWCRSRMIRPWRGLASWREILVKDLETSIVAFMEIIVMTHLNAMTWSNKLRPLSNRENYNDMSAKKWQTHHKNRLLEGRVNASGHL